MLRCFFVCFSIAAWKLICSDLVEKIGEFSTHADGVHGLVAAESAVSEVLALKDEVVVSRAFSSLLLSLQGMLCLFLESKESVERHFYLGALLFVLG